MDPRPLSPEDRIRRETVDRLLFELTEEIHEKERTRPQGLFPCRQAWESAMLSGEKGFVGEDPIGVPPEILETWEIALSFPSLTPTQKVGCGYDALVRALFEDMAKTRRSRPGHITPEGMQNVLAIGYNIGTFQASIPEADRLQEMWD